MVESIYILEKIIFTIKWLISMMTKKEDPALHFCWAIQESNIPKQQRS